MKAQCRASANAASEKEMSDKEAKMWENRMRWASDSVRDEDPQKWKTMSGPDRIKAAKDRLVQSIQDNAARLSRNAERNAEVMGGALTLMHSHDQQFKMGASEALRRMIDAPHDGKNVEGNYPLSTAIAARRAEALSDFAYFFNKVGRKWLDFQDKPVYRAFLWEAMGQDSSGFCPPKKLAEVRKYADLWKQGAENWRNLANNVGSNISRRENYIFPQSYVRDNVIKDSKEDFVKKMDPLLDKNAYLDNNGVPLSDAERQKIVSKIHENFLDDDNSGFGPEGRIAGRHSQRRVLIYKDADSYMKAMDYYGDQNVANAMINHATRMSRDIELMNQFGSNPDAMLKTLTNYAEEYDRINYPKKSKDMAKIRAKTQLVYDYLSGKYTQTYGSDARANAFEAGRNVMTGLHIGFYPVKHISDIGRMYGNMIYRDANWLHLLREQVSSANPFNPGYRNMIEASGAGLERYTKEVAAYGSDVIGPLWSQKYAKFMVGVTGGPSMQAGNRRAYSAMMWGLMSRVLKNYSGVEKLGTVDKQIFNSAGITNKELAVYRLAEPEKAGGRTLLTPRSVRTIPDAKIDPLIKDKISEINASEDKDSIPARLAQAREDVRGQAARKLLALANEETNMSIITPAASTQAEFRDIAKRGTWLGEIAGSTLQFKNFIISLGARMADRFNSIPTTAGKTFYGVRMAAITMVSGAVITAIDDILHGRDPSFSLNGKNMLKWGSNGGFTIINEILDKMANSHSAGDAAKEAASFALGPVAGTAFQAAAIPLVAAFAKKGEELNKLGKEGAKFLQSNFPFREWYTGAIIDRLLNKELMENANPGGVERATQRMQQETGQGNFWNPLDPNPTTGITRAPQPVTKSPQG